MTQAVVRVRTPENVELEYQLAGVGSRAIAQIIDSLILFCVYVLIGIAVIYWGISHMASVATPYIIGFAILLSFLILWGYFILFEYYMSGQTLGKLIVKVRVVQQDGRNASFLPVLLRNVFRLIDILPSGYLVGVVVMMIDGKERRLGDLVAGTIVVRATANQQFAWLDDMEVERERKEKHQEKQWKADGTSGPDVDAAFEVLKVKGLGTNLAVSSEIPPSWKTFLIDLDKRLRNMPKTQRVHLVELTWERMFGQEWVQLVSEDGTLSQTTANLDDSRYGSLDYQAKVKCIVALAGYLRRQQGRKRD